MTADTRARSKEAPAPERNSIASALHFDKRLLAYALAGAGAVALTQAASAEIVFTPADVTLTNGTLDIDLNQDQRADFVIDNQQTCSFYFCGGSLLVHGVGKSARGVIGHTVHRGGRASAVPTGFPIGQDSPKVFLTSSWVNMVRGFWSYSLGQRFGGPWANVADRFLGLRFAINGELHYGWARFTVELKPSQYPTIRATLTGYAYETEPDKTILAGDRGFGPEASTGAPHPDDASLKTDRTRQPSSLGLLSLGSIGLDAWRQLKH
jgi:hypothetical protein